MSTCILLIFPKHLLDNVRQDKLSETLSRIHYKDIYKGQSARLEIGSSLTENIKIRKGRGQGLFYLWINFKKDKTKPTEVIE